MSAKDRTIFVTMEAGTDDVAMVWRSVVMGLSRRLSELADRRDDLGSDLFQISVSFYVPYGYYKPDWVGLKVRRFSRSENLLPFDVALPERLTDDPLGLVLDYFDQAVGTAIEHARKKGVDLPLLRHDLQKLRLLGPLQLGAPVPGRGVPASGPVRLNPTVDLRVTTSTGERDDDPSEDLLILMLEDLVEGEETQLTIERSTALETEVLRVMMSGDSIQLVRTSGDGAGGFEAFTHDFSVASDQLVTWAFRDKPQPPGLSWAPAGHVS